MDDKKSLADANNPQEQVSKPTENTEKAAAGAQTPLEPAKEAQLEQHTEIKQSDHNIDIKQPDRKIEEHQHQPEKKHEEHAPASKHRSLHLHKIISKITFLHPLNIKNKLNHYRIEYGRVLHLTRKPTRTEYKELAIMVAVGTLIIGVIGFIVQMIIQFI